MRHGKPCLHVTEGGGIALNVGDYSLALINQLVLSDQSYSPELKVRLLEELARMVTRTVQGQALDLGWARDGRYDVSVDEYLDMAARKTACYTVSAPLLAGAVIAGASGSHVEVLRRIGERLGQGFQVRDDLLDFVGDPKIIGKTRWSDIRAGKLSFPIVWALGASPDAAELEAVLRSRVAGEDDVRRAVSIVAASGALEAAERIAAECYRDFESVLCATFGESEVRERLLQVAWHLCMRES